tara:strand:+ start:209 stop:616 length:408 start_codon:yes stop_codon:yes gene_type:complete
MKGVIKTNTNHASINKFISIMTHVRESDSTQLYTNEYAIAERPNIKHKKLNVNRGQKNTPSRTLLILALGNCSTMQKITTPRMPHMKVPGASAIPKGFNSVLLTPPNPNGFNSVLLYGEWLSFILAFDYFHDIKK